jgi:uncharacterized protein YndB with AHSA1/START domain
MLHDKITVEITVAASVEKVWNLWTNPKHIIYWNNASDDWHTPRAENDLKPGGRFSYRMEAKDGSSQFDFEGIYDEVKTFQMISYTLGDGRKVEIIFSANEDETKIVESFQPESTHSLEMQQFGWQSILNNFKNYAETFDKLETLFFQIEINAERNKVYTTMLDKKGFSEWTSIFNPSSRFEGNWQKDSKILFIGTNQEGQTEGMVAIIAENIPGKFVHIKYNGIVMANKEITSGPDIDGWAGGSEKYFFDDLNGGTLLKVEMDSNPQFKSYFIETYPKALEKLKLICESVE